MASVRNDDNVSGGVGYGGSVGGIVVNGGVVGGVDGSKLGGLSAAVAPFGITGSRRRQSQEL